jgi:hypothetical protein
VIGGAILIAIAVAVFAFTARQGRRVRNIEPMAPATPA